MARGFESKDVEFQQAEAERTVERRRTLTAEERDAEAMRRTLELALVRAANELSTARSAAHRQMLQGAIAALQERIRRLK